MLEWLAVSPLAFWVKESWGHPIALTVHTFGSALTVGFALIALIHLTGMLKAPSAQLLPKLIPVVWLGLVLQVVSGSLLMLTVGPIPYLSDGWFVAKLAFIGIGIAATLYLQRVLKTDARADSPILDGRNRWLAIVPLVWVAVFLAAVTPRYQTPYEGGWVYGYVTFWTLPLVLVILAIVFGFIHIVNKRT